MMRYCHVHHWAWCWRYNWSQAFLGGKYVSNYQLFDVSMKMLFCRQHFIRVEFNRLSKPSPPLTWPFSDCAPCQFNRWFGQTRWNTKGPDKLLCYTQSRSRWTTCLSLNQICYWDLSGSICQVRCGKTNRHNLDLGAFGDYLLFSLLLVVKW